MANFQEQIEKIREAIVDSKQNSLEEVEEFRLKFLSKKGIISDLFNQFRDVSVDEKRELGQKLNQLKQLATEKYNTLKESISEFTIDSKKEDDISRPSYEMELGSRHPISIVRNELVDIFGRLGFSVAEGPEIEDDNHVFTKLNFAPEHPARDMQDTFFILRHSAEDSNPNDILLRTHTSSVQIRVMEKQQPPIKAIFPGRVFRNEAISARAHCIFHQVEGLYVDKGVSFVDLKQTLLFFAREMFGKETQIRLRPSYFPFTEPSAEMDVSCSICGGKGCNICKGTGWLEVLGCGMVHPNVLENCGIDSKIYSGFAFGVGIERLTMLKYHINDLRLYFENDKRFLDQFKAAF